MQPPPPGLDIPDYSNKQIPAQPPGLNLKFNLQGPPTGPPPGITQNIYAAIDRQPQPFQGGPKQKTPQQKQPYQIKNYLPIQKQIAVQKMHPMQFIQNQTLESLDIGLKVQNEDENDQTTLVKNLLPPNLNHVSIQLDQDEIITEYCYIEPKIQDLIITSEGLILDSTNNNSIGLWDKNFQLQKCYKGLLQPFSGDYKMIPLQENKILVNSEQTFSIFDLNDGSMKEIWNCGAIPQQFNVTNHMEPRLYAVFKEQICIWKLKNIIGKGEAEPQFYSKSYNGQALKSNDDIDLIKTIKTRFCYCENIIVLDNGILLGKNQSVGEVLSLDLESEEVLEVYSTQGANITLWAIMNYDTVAMVRDQQIMIVEFKIQYGKVIKQIQYFKDDVLREMIPFPQNNLAAVTCHGDVRVWNLDTGKCLKQITNAYVKSQSNYNLKQFGDDTLMIYSLEEKYLQLYKIDYQPLLELTNYINLKGRVRVVNYCKVSSCGKYICLIQECGTFRNGELDFRTEIEVYTINCPVNKSIHHKKVIEVGGILDASNFTFYRGTCMIQKSKSLDDKLEHSQDIQIQEEPSLLYVQHKQIGLIAGQLVQWFFNQEQVVKVDLLVESFDRCQIYWFDRILFSYSYEKAVEVLSQQNYDGFNMFAPNPIKRQNSSSSNQSGIMVYNSDQKLLLQVKFDQQFKVNAFAMPNCNFLFFLNQKNTIEAWNVITQSMIQKADCRPSIIMDLKFQKEQPHLIFLMGQGEWIVRNFKLGLICKRKTEKTELKKVEFPDDQTCVVLHGKKILEVWSLKENISQVIRVDFDLCDFFVYKNEQESSVIVVGDYCMQKVFSKKRDGF